ncbi:MAG: HEAT repeat domain-containing protein [Planctomycetaceae bacterium]|nr:HEAT repeat domain-containing protein [Planctomycetaceae bacterium]
MDFLRTPRMVKGLFVILILGSISSPSVYGEEENADLGLAVADGFEVTRFAGDELCHDVFSMTVTSEGHIAVSGPGYVRVLIDSDHDGVADDSRVFVDGPESGAQGMFFYGPDLLCTGDAGLIRYRDRDRDGKADGPPDVFLRARAGAEHDIHAIRKGPDGYWYVISGNSAEIDERYITLDSSPIQHPHAGTVVRFKPDLTSGEVFADGIRNAYDFDFAQAGDLFVFDSDGERDLSLPWYQPTRVFHVPPGSNLGWYSNSHIRPSSSFDVPPTLASLGRSSPTGVVCYRHTAFPLKYQGALFVLDWTFGRIWSLPVDEHGGTWKTNPEVFLTATGEHGFAPTDAEVGPDGALYVCIGGRGTRGGVFRIAPKGKQLSPWNVAVERGLQGIDTVLNAPQPLCSWSRAIWEPIAKQLGREAFRDAALATTRPGGERVRAIEILTEKFEGIDADMAAILAKDANPFVRARAAWSLGRSNPAHPDIELLRPYLQDSQPQVARAALESLLGAESELLDNLTEELGHQLAHADPTVRQVATNVVSKVSKPAYQKTAVVAINHGWQGAVPLAAAFSLRNAGYQPYPIDIATRLLNSPNQPVGLRVDAARLLQIGLGELGGNDPTLAPALQGYVSQADLATHDQELDALRILLAKTYPTEHAELNRELEIAISMLQPPNPEVLTKVMANVTADSSAVDDIHWLIVASRIPVAVTAEQRDQIASTLVGLERKVREQELAQDISWDERVVDVYRVLVKQDEQLPLAILNHPEFGEPGHVQFATEMPPKLFKDVVAVFIKQLDANPDYEWSTDLVYLLGAAEDPAIRQRVYEQFDDYALRSAVLMSLSEYPLPEDRTYFVQGLDTADVEVLLKCIQALAIMPGSVNAVENVTLARTLRRLGYDGDERQARDQVAELLQRNLGVSCGYRLARDGDPQREAVELWTATVQKQFPGEFKEQFGRGTEDVAELKTVLASVPWEQGEAERGLKIFTSRGCVQCHGGRKALGPDLAGAASRFSRDDLFTAIAFPHQDVSPRYQTTQIATTRGQIHTGLVVYEYPDALVLRDARNKSFRIDTADIEERRTLQKSLMPEGLLKDLKPEDLADLYTYLHDLSIRTAQNDLDNRTRQ